MGVPFIKVSVIYFFIGVSLGFYMGVTDSFQFTSAHAHVNLLGWVSLAVSGVIYQIFPVAGNHRLADYHFWLMMAGVPLLFFAMICFGLGQSDIGEPVSGLGGLLMIMGVVVFMVNVIKNVNVKAEER